MRKQKTRKRVRKNSRRKSMKRRMHKRQKQQGGNYAKDVTKRTIDDMPVTDKAVISIAGQPPMSVGAFEDHAKYRDFQGEEQ